eukprot:Skav209977  [mRNA]  locus=scaffold1046:81008:92612:+ [translate_table: standard]
MWCQAPGTDLLSELPSDLPRDLSLVLAARQGQQNLVEALLASRANARDPHGGSALLRAVQLGITARPCIEALLKASADVGAQSDFGETPLSEAAGSGPPELLRTLLAASHPSVPSPTALATALAKTAETRNRGTARRESQGRCATGLLLEAKAPVTPEAFVAWGDTEMLEALLEHKADVNACRGRGGVARTRRRSGAGGSGQSRQQRRGAAAVPLQGPDRSAEPRADDVVATLLDFRASLEASERLGDDMGHRLVVPPPTRAMSPLVVAALSGSAAVVQRLLAARAAVDALDAVGRSALAAAAATGTVQLCQLLLQARADPNLPGTSGSGGSGAAPLSIAVAAGHRAPGINGQFFWRQEMQQIRNWQVAKAQVNPRSGNKSCLVLGAGVGSPEICVSSAAGRPRRPGRPERLGPHGLGGGPPGGPGGAGAAPGAALTTKEGQQRVVPWCRGEDGTWDFR